MQPTKTLNYLFIVLILSSIIAGCAKDGATGPAGKDGANGANGTNGTNGATGATGPVLSGNLFGYVKTFDQYGSPIVTGLSGIKVNLTGGSLNISVTTDTAGKYTFDSLTTGYYNIAYSDSLFGSNLVSNAQFLGGGTIARANVNISKIPNFNVTSLAYTDTVLNLTDSVIQISGTISAANPLATSVILYVGSSAGTSSVPSSYLSFYTRNLVATATTFKITVPLSDLYDLGFAAGGTVYFSCYGIASNFSNSSSYEDFNTGKTVFTAISPVPVTGSHIIL
jgi:hypothetical protein